MRAIVIKQYGGPEQLVIEEFFVSGTGIRSSLVSLLQGPG